MELNKRAVKAYLKEMAMYGERAYRRGLQQGIALQVDEKTASDLRHRSDEFVFEVCDLPNQKFKLIKKDIFHRFIIEEKGPLTMKLIQEIDLTRRTK